MRRNHLGRAALIWALGACAVALSPSGSALASDHIDGPVTKSAPFADLSDLYAFPGAGGDSLVIALNAYPIAPASAHPAEGVSYAIVLRKARTAEASFETSDEIRIDCTFKAREEPYGVTCRTSSGLTASAEQDADTSTGDFPLFFGRRSDPFFFDGAWSQTVSTGATLPPPGAENTMSSLNVLSLVIELRRAQLFAGDFDLLAIAAEAQGQRREGQVQRFDRLGRPEITNVSLVAHGSEEDLRDEYNAAEPFATLERGDAYRARLAKNIAYYDALDGRTDWEPGEPERMAALLIDDFLVVDIAKPCSGDNFLEIERALLRGEPHETCGGRKLGDDVMDRLYGLYINAGTAPLGDGVSMPDAVPLEAFPYLAPPATGLWACIKALIGDSKADR